MIIKYTFKKQERLTGKKNFENLLATGRQIKIFPFIVYWTYIGDQDYPVRIAVTIPKKKFKKAVDRNLLKRKFRESYRINKHILYNSLIESNKKIHVLVVYISDKIVDLEGINNKSLKMLEILRDEVLKEQISQKS